MDASANPSSSAGTSNSAMSSSSAMKISSASTLVKSSSSSVTTPKRQLSSDRERVQNFLLQRQNSSGGITSASGSGGVTPKGAPVAKPAMSAVERAKLVMAKKVVPAKPAGARPAALGAAGSMAVKRTNPLTDILKGGSGSIVGGAPAAKRPRTKSEKPGEIKIQGGRSSIQVCFMHWCVL